MNRNAKPHAFPKADSKTVGALMVASASWSAAVLCRLRMPDRRTSHRKACSPRPARSFFLMANSDTPRTHADGNKWQRSGERLPGTWQTGEPESNLRYRRAIPRRHRTAALQDAGAFLGTPNAIRCELKRTVLGILPAADEPSAYFICGVASPGARPSAHLMPPRMCAW